MKCLVVYDSVFGNTKKVAETIDGEIGDCCNVVNVKDVTIDDEYDLIVIGSPTRAFRPTPEIVKFAKSLSPKDVKKLAFFDTRMDIKKIENKLLSWMEKRFGYANDTLVNIFTKKKMDFDRNYGEFFVDDSEGPLRDGEIDRVVNWINEIKKNKPIE